MFFSATSASRRLGGSIADDKNHRTYLNKQRIDSEGKIFQGKSHFSDIFQRVVGTPPRLPVYRVWRSLAP